MKRKALGLILCLLLFMSGHTFNAFSQTNTLSVLTAKVSDYYPFIKDVHMKYKGIGNEFAPYETFVDYIRGHTIQVRSINGGTVMVSVYLIKNGSLIKTFSRGETYYRYDYTSSSNQNEIMIKEPIIKGTSWKLKDGALRSITAIDQQVKTPAGTFKALEITTKRQDSIQKDYYVKNTGLIKTVFTSTNNSYTVTSELEKIEKGVPYKHPVRFYFPEFLKNRVVYILRNVEIFTNQDMKYKFQKELKTIPANSALTKVLSTNTQVLGSNIDEKKGIVTVNFSSHLVKEMNAGTSLESMLIRSIVNTFGDYYHMKKVILLLEGKPYESGHILLKQGEYLTVDKTKTAEYKPS